jgi:Ser/Thr protein kinase RdoA (MazF antagonist)
MGRAFAELTPRGQLQRLRALAHEALRRYDLDVTKVVFAARAFNSVFRVDTREGTRYALRVSPQLRIHADGCEALEAAWITALRREVAFPTPAVIPTRDASAYAWVRADGVPEPRCCVLFEWVSGRRLREHINSDLVRKVGELTAAVHEHASAEAPADVPTGALVGDRVLYFRTEHRLEELRPAYGSLLDDAVDRAQRVLDELWRDPPHPPHLLHGDVQPGNVIASRGKVSLIDFQDLIWGFDIQDVEFAQQALDHFDDAGALIGAFRAGYESVRPLPVASGETIGGLQAARHLNVLNFGLNVRNVGLDAFIARHADPVVEWMAG